MDREYIRQVESPITPPKKSACVLGGKLAAGQRFVRGKRGRVEGRVERVDRKSWRREEREDAKRFGEKRLAKIQTVIARACLSGARPEYFSLLFSVSGPLFISCQPSPLARLRLPRSYSSPCCCSSSRPLPSLPSLFFLFTSRASSSCSFFHDRKRDYESEYWQKHGMKYSVTIYISREKKRERGDISGYNLSWKGVGGEVGRSGSRRS